MKHLGIRHRLLGLGVAALVGLIPSVALGAAGALDTTFHGDGKVTTPVGGGEANAVAVQPDRKIVAVGYNGDDVVVVRYKANGAADTTFGGDGIVTTPMGSSGASGNDVALQPDGKIVVAAEASNGTDTDFAVIRYRPGGGLDTSFDDDGRVMTSVGVGADEPEAVAIQPDGKIVVVGEANNGTDRDFAVVRYKANGDLDGSFNGTGKLMLDLAGDSDQATAVAVRPNGKIVVGGTSLVGSQLDFALARLNPDGTPDAGFTGGGKVTTPVGAAGDRPAGLGVQSDGKIVLAGYSENATDEDFALVRYRPNGALDTGFGGDGKVTTPIGAARDEGYDIAITDDGRIVVAGITRSATDDDFAVARYKPDGSLDRAFSSDGLAVTDLAGDTDDAFAVALQPGGKIIVAGSTIQGSDYVFALARYKGRSGRRITLRSSVRRPPEGKRFRLSGRVRSADRLCRARVKVQIARDILGGRVKYKPVKTVRTRADGRYRLRRTADRPARYRARVRGTDSCAEATAKRAVRVRS